LTLAGKKQDLTLRCILDPEMGKKQDLTLRCILGYQGLLDASGYDYITSENVGGAISGCHSLGTLTCNNLVARGYASSAQLNSLPFGNIAVSKNATITNLGQWDIINGGWLGRLFNPISNSTPCSNGGASGAFCHGWDANYR
jgi:hypothetical protein